MPLNGLAYCVHETIHIQTSIIQKYKEYNYASFQLLSNQIQNEMSCLEIRCLFYKRTRGARPVLWGRSEKRSRHHIIILKRCNVQV